MSTGIGSASWTTRATATRRSRSATVLLATTPSSPTCRARANRMFRQSALVVPLNLLGSGVALPRRVAHRRGAVGAGVGGRDRRRRVGARLAGGTGAGSRRSGCLGDGPDDRDRRVGVVLGCAPARRRAPRATSDVTPMIALLFPVGSAALGAVMSAPVGALLPRLGRRQPGPAALLAPVPRDRPPAARGGRGHLRRVVVGLPPCCERCRRAVGNARSAHGCVDGRARRRP